MAGRNIDRIKDTQKDAQRNLETKKGELSQLEERKRALLESGMDIQNSEMDDDSKKVVMELLNNALEENSEKGEELSREMNDDFANLENAKQELAEMSESTDEERRKLEGKKSVLDKFGLGGKIDDAIGKMDDSKQQLEGVRESLVETEKELSNISSKLNSL